MDVNNHHLLNKSNERTLRAESLQYACSSKRKIREQTDDVQRQGKARTILHDQGNRNRSHGRPENSSFRAGLQCLDLRRGREY